MARTPPEQAVYDAIVAGEAPSAQSAAAEALGAGVQADRVLRGSLMPAMAEVGRLFEDGEYFVPELLVAARAMKAVLEVLRPQLVAGAAGSGAGRVVVGTAVLEVLRPQLVAAPRIGRGPRRKNLVCMMLEGSGFEVTDLGVDVPPDRFVAAATQANADLIVMSALLTTTMPAMKDVIKAVDAAGLRPRVRIMVGGAPVTQQYADQIGADGYSTDASSAVRVARSLLQRS
eukprot:m51a1_g10534 putative trimethylamine corrinoid protein 2 (tcp 2) (230) ;mRNA; f:249940-251003